MRWGGGAAIDGFVVREGRSGRAEAAGAAAGWGGFKLVRESP